MTSHEYREQAEKLLGNTIFGARPSPAAIEEAGVWARLAQAAATTEAATATQTSEEK